MVRFVKTSPIARSRRGAILMLVALLLPVLLVISFMAINIAFMHLSRTELRIATDAASRAGGRILALTGDKAEVRTFARDAAARNMVAGHPLQLADSDFDFGRSVRTGLAARYDFNSDNSSPTPNSLVVTGRRTSGSANGPIGLIAPRIMGIGTFEPTSSAMSTQIELDICLVMDRSGSMAYTSADEAGVVFPPPNAPADWDFGDPIPPDSRWLDARAAAAAFLDEMAATPIVEYVALSTYSDTASFEVDLTTNYGQITTAIDAHSAAFAGGATNVGGGIIEGLSAFSRGHDRPWATKVIVILTDGIHNTGTNPFSASSAAKSDSVIVYTVTFSDEAEESTMEQVAETTGGFHVHATDGAQLIQAFRDIANSLPTLLTQ